MLEAGPAAGGAAPVAGVEAEGPGGVAALPGQGRGGQGLAQRVQGADVARRVGARGPPDGGLVHQQRVADQLRPDQGGVGPGQALRVALGPGQGAIEAVAHERGLAGARDPGDDHQALERDLEIHPGEVVLARPEQAQPRLAGVWRLAQAGAGPRPGARPDSPR